MEDKEVNMNNHILYVNDDILDKISFDYNLEHYGFITISATSLAHAQKIMMNENIGVIITPYYIRDGLGGDLIKLYPDTPIIVLIEQNEVELAIQAMKAGAYSYLVKDTNNAYLKILPISCQQAIKQKQNELLLKKMQQAIEQSPSLIVITDTQGVIEYVNPKTCEVTEYSNEELIGSNPRLLKSSEFNEEYLNQLWVTITEGNIWYGELLNKTKSGKLFWEFASIAPLKNFSGIITHYVKTGIDITDYKNSQIEKIKQEKLISTIELAGAVSHEINQPLQVILGYIDIIHDHLKDNQSFHKTIKSINANINRITLICEKIKNITEYNTIQYVNKSQIFDINNQKSIIRDKKVFEDEPGIESILAPEPEFFALKPPIQKQQQVINPEKDKTEDFGLNKIAEMISQHISQETNDSLISIPLPNEATIDKLDEKQFTLLPNLSGTIEELTEQDKTLYVPEDIVILEKQNENLAVPEPESKQSVKKRSIVKKQQPEQQQEQKIILTNINVSKTPLFKKDFTLTELVEKTTKKRPETKSNPLHGSDQSNNKQSLMDELMNKINLNSEIITPSLSTSLEGDKPVNKALEKENTQPVSIPNNNKVPKEASGLRDEEKTPLPNVLEHKISIDDFFTDFEINEQIDLTITPQKTEQLLEEPSLTTGFSTDLFSAHEDKVNEPETLEPDLIQNSNQESFPEPINNSNGESILHNDDTFQFSTPLTMESLFNDLVQDEQLIPLDTPPPISIPIEEQMIESPPFLQSQSGLFDEMFFSPSKEFENELKQKEIDDQKLLYGEDFIPEVTIPEIPSPTIDPVISLGNNNLYGDAPDLTGFSIDFNDPIIRAALEKKKKKKTLENVDDYIKDSKKEQIETEIIRSIEQKYSEHQETNIETYPIKDIAKSSSINPEPVRETKQELTSVLPVLPKTQVLTIDDLDHLLIEEDSTEIEDIALPQGNITENERDISITSEPKEMQVQKPQQKKVLDINNFFDTDYT